MRSGDFHSCAKPLFYLGKINFLLHRGLQNRAAAADAGAAAAAAVVAVATVALSETQRVAFGGPSAFWSSTWSSKASPDSTRMAQRWPKRLPRGSQDDQEAPKRLREACKRFPRASWKSNCRRDFEELNVG